jgi:polysaccharide deacetylase family protein (PEP-CTERM system associated)
MTNSLFPPCVLLTIDVEDWFQVENFKSVIPFSTWKDRDLRVERNTHRLLDLFDSDNPTPRSSNPPKTTFFVLGWIARSLPHLVREIHSRGHEVASHGFAHELCTNQHPDKLKADLMDSKALLEDIVGEAVAGYRAPSFSINRDVLKTIEACGFQYDSSYNSFGLHGRYGKVDFSGCEKAGIAYILSDSFHELPVSNFRIRNHVAPLSGGGYFRLMPFPLFKLGIKRILAETSAYLFYMHPWEIDPKQPRVEGIPRSFQFRHYVNLDKTLSRLSRLLTDFNDCRFIPLRDYLKIARAPLP